MDSQLISQEKAKEIFSFLNVEWGRGGTQSVFISAKMKLGEGHLLNNESKYNYLVNQCMSVLANTLLHYSGFCAQLEFWVMQLL